MIDIDELIEDLKLDLEWAEANEWESPICLADNLADAIHTILEMQETIAKLKVDITKLEYMYSSKQFNFDDLCEAMFND